MTIDTAQHLIPNSTGPYLMSFSFRPQQGQHTKYPRHSRCVLPVYLSCDLPELPEGTKDYNEFTSPNQLVRPPLHRLFAILFSLGALYHPLLLHLGQCHGLNFHGSIDF